MLMNLLGKMYLKAIGSGVLLAADGSTEATTKSAIEESIEKKIFGPMDILINVICYGMAGVGVIICIKAVVDFITAYPQHDSAAMVGAAKWLVAGLLLASIGILIPIFRSDF